MVRLNDKERKIIKATVSRFFGDETIYLSVVDLMRAKKAVVSIRMWFQRTKSTINYAIIHNKVKQRIQNG